jgi:lipoprotein-anchoring transpeptidase ErfK/SrfK
MRRIVIYGALAFCLVDAVAGSRLGAPHLEPPRVAALAAFPVPPERPDPPPLQPFATYEPRPYVAPDWQPLEPEPTTTPPPPSPSPMPSPTTTLVPSPPSGEVAVASAPAPVPVPATVARVLVAQLRVFVAPGDAKPNVTLASTTEWGNPRVLLATQLRGDWIQVLLPVRPNNAVGWVRSTDVALSTVADAVDVDLAARTLTWTRAGAVVLQTVVAVGAPSTWTPTGTFFVTDIFPDDPRGPHGAWVLALNAHSDAFTVFEGGDPRIAIHGTNDPSSIGRAASNGCVRVELEPLTALATSLQPGTPVTVH